MEYELSNYELTEKILKMWVAMNIMEIKSVISIRKSPGLKSFKGEFYQNFKIFLQQST